MANLRISPLQWHPFTFIPGKRPNTLRAIVKSYGRWSQHLMERCGAAAGFRLDASPRHVSSMHGAHMSMRLPRGRHAGLWDTEDSWDSVII